VLATDAVVSGIVLSGLLLLLRNVAKYVHFTDFSVKQQFINYGALAILFVACQVGAGFMALYLSFSEKEWMPMVSSIPVRIVLAVSAYVLAIIIFTKIYDNENTIAETVNEPDASDNCRPDKAVNNEILERIAVKNGQKIDVIPVSEIIHIQAEGDYVMIYSVGGKYLKEQTMKSLESSLPPDRFVRVHRSGIVNVEFISQIELYDKQSQLLKLKNGNQVRMSPNG
jgi:DNA-binding LytR/AlgR family response regulator